MLPEATRPTSAPDIPEKLPDCAVRLLARRQWFSDHGIFQRARLAPANRLALWLSGPTFARRSDIAAITLGNTIYFRASRHFNPHSARGLSLLAHELKHVEQFEHSGPAGFYSSYLWAYLRHGYGDGIPQEAEAYALGHAVYAQIDKELRANAGQPCCLGTLPGHRANPAFVLLPVKAW